VLHHHHRIGVRQIDQSHRPVAEFSLADFMQTDHLHIFVARVTQDAPIKLVDHRTLAFEHLQKKTCALAQHTGDLMDFVEHQSGFQNRASDGAGLRPRTATDIKSANQHGYLL